MILGLTGKAFSLFEESAKHLFMRYNNNTVVIDLMKCLDC